MNKIDCTEHRSTLMDIHGMLSSLLLEFTDILLIRFTFYVYHVNRIKKMIWYTII